MIRHVLFDLDGTLTDSADGITRCIAGAVDSLGGSAPPLGELIRFIGTPLSDIFASLLGTSDEARIHDAIAHYRERFDRVGYAENRVYAGVCETLEALRGRGLSLFVATAKNQADARRVIDHFDLGNHFDEVHGVTNDAERRDKAVLVARILGDRRIEPATAAMIGDRAGDMRAAHQTGIRAIGAGWGYGSRDELLAAGAHTIAENPMAVLADF